MTADEPKNGSTADVEGAWQVQNVTPFYESKWIQLAHADVILPSGERNPKHHMVTMPAAAMAVVLSEDETSVLMSWRHRFVSDVWNWNSLAAWLIQVSRPPKLSRGSWWRRRATARARSPIWSRSSR